MVEMHYVQVNLELIYYLEDIKVRRNLYTPPSKNCNLTLTELSISNELVTVLYIMTRAFECGVTS